MSAKHKNTDVHASILKDEFNRQRWELFHRAIALAKQSNQASLEDAESSPAASESSGPLLSIVR